MFIWGIFLNQWVVFNHKDLYGYEIMSSKEMVRFGDLTFNASERIDISLDQT